MARYTSSATVLTAGSTWTSDIIEVGLEDSIAGSVWADQVGTLFVEQSNDLTNWDVSISHAVTASTSTPFNDPVYLPFARLRYLNGGVNQGVFRVNARPRAAGAST